MDEGTGGGVTEKRQKKIPATIVDEQGREVVCLDSSQSQSQSPEKAADNGNGNGQGVGGLLGLLGSGATVAPLFKPPAPVEEVDPFAYHRSLNLDNRMQSSCELPPKWLALRTVLSEIRTSVNKAHQRGSFSNSSKSEGEGGDEGEGEGEFKGDNKGSSNYNSSRVLLLFEKDDALVRARDFLQVGRVGVSRVAAYIIPLLVQETKINLCGG